MISGRIEVNVLKLAYYQNQNFEAIPYWTCSNYVEIIANVLIVTGYLPDPQLLSTFPILHWGCSS